MKRTPIRRKAPLKARTPLARSGRLNPVSAKRRSRDKVYPGRRAEVYERAGGRCEARIHVDGCTGRCEQVHHLAGRGGPDPHRLDNLLGVCAPCHHFIHVEPAAAMRAGVVRSRHGGAA